MSAARVPAIGRKLSRKTKAPSQDMARKRTTSTGQNQLDAGWINSRMKDVGIKNFSELARQLNIDRALVNRSMKGDRPFNLNDITAMARVLKAPLHEVIRRLGYDAPLEGVPIVGKITPDGKVSTVSARKGTLYEMDGPPPGAECLVAETGTGPLGFVNGAAFLYLPASEKMPVAATSLGQLCVIEADDHLNPFLGVLQKGIGRGSSNIVLFGTNETLTVQQVHRASPVIAIHFP